MKKTKGTIVVNLTGNQVHELLKTFFIKLIKNTIPRIEELIIDDSVSMFVDESGRVCFTCQVFSTLKNTGKSTLSNSLSCGLQRDEVLEFTAKKILANKLLKVKKFTISELKFNSGRLRTNNEILKFKIDY